MRTSILASVLTLLFLQFGFSQETSLSNHESNAGIKAGYNLSSVRADNGSETNHKSGFYLGVYGESFIGKLIAIQPELMYSQQGYEIKTNSYKYTQKLNYINFRANSHFFYNPTG